MPALTKPKPRVPSRATKARKTTPARKATSKPKAPSKASPPAPQAKPVGAKAMDRQGAAQGDWREGTLARIRALIRQADPDVVEEVKWRKPSNAMKGVPVWSHDGMICTGETYKDKVKFTFAKGAALADPTGLFNAIDTGATRRSIDLHEGDDVDAAAFKALVKSAVALNSQ